MPTNSIEKEVSAHKADYDKCKQNEGLHNGKR